MSGLISSPALRTAAHALALASAALALPAAPAATTNTYAVKVPKTFEYNTTGVIRTTTPAAAATVHGPNQLTFDGVSRGAYVTDSGQPIQLGQFEVHPTTTASGASATTTYDHTPFAIQVHAPSFDKTSSVPVLANALPSFGRTFHLKNQTINSLLVRGHLDGTVNGSSNSSVTATVDSVKLGSLVAPDKHYATTYAFPVRSTDLQIPTTWTMTAAGTATNTTSAASNLTTTASPAGRAVSAAQILANPAAETLSSTNPASTSTSTDLAQSTTTTADPTTTTLMLTSTNLANPTPTPEPTTAVIFAAGLGALALAHHRRRAK